MTGDDISWSTVAVTFITIVVPTTLGFLLSRKNANKKLNLEETSVVLSGTADQIKTYQDLLNRANEAVSKAEALNQEFSDRVKNLEQTKDIQSSQITILRNLFMQVVNRSNIILTAAEQAEFDSTKPTAEVFRQSRQRPSRT
jgi:hypothetical protein